MRPPLSRALWIKVLIWSAQSSWVRKVKSSMPRCVLINTLRICCNDSGNKSALATFGYDDSLDVVAVHLVGGIVGSVLLGVFADRSVNELGKDGVLNGGGWGLFGEQVLAVTVVLAFSLIVSFGIGLLLKVVLPKGIRASEEDEEVGLDLSQHSEAGYSLERV